MLYWKFTFLLGTIFLIISFYLWISHEIHDVDAYETKDKINLAYSDNIDVNGIEFNFITHTDPQYVNIHYSVIHKENKTGFIAIDFPYRGILIDSQNEWQTKAFEETNSIVLFKNYTCTSTKSCLTDNGDLKFIFEKPIISIKNFKHFIQIPFSSGAHNIDVTNFYNQLAKIPSFQGGWDKGTTIVKVTLPSDVDEWITQPESKLEQFQNSNGKYIVLVWPITNSDLLLTGNYISPHERFMAEAKPTLFGVMIGIGFSMVVVAVQTKHDESNTRFLKKTIEKTETNISNTLQDINSIVENEHLDRKEKELEENRIYKISLLHDLSGIIMAIYHTLHYVKHHDASDKIVKPTIEEIITAQTETFRYWANRISLININTYVPANIRDSVSMLLHQGIKPISTPAFAFEYNFLENTVLSYLTAILDSDYMKKDPDLSVQHFLETTKKSRDFLLTLKNEL